MKREKIYTLVKILLDRDVPIHGVGLQAHSILCPSLDDIRAAIERYGLGLGFRITELDMSRFMHNDERPDPKRPTEQVLGSS